MCAIPERGTSDVCDHLKQQIEEDNLVLFVGSGVSVNSSVEVGGQSVRPATWDGLVSIIEKELFRGRGNEYSKFLREKKESGEMDLLDRMEYLDFVAQKLGRERDIRSWLEKAIEKPAPGVRFEPNEWHRALLSLGDKGPRVTVTTNFDTLLERGFGDEGFETYQYNASNLTEALSGNTTKRPIFKYHGTISRADGKLILCAKDYAKIREEGALMCDILRSLLLTRTALFVGYSLNDPDLKEILSSIFVKYGREVRPMHYILHQDGLEIDYREAMLKECYGVMPLKYDLKKKEDGSEDHSGGLKILKKLTL